VEISIFVAYWFTVQEPWFVRLQIKQTRSINGSMSFDSGVDSTALRLRSPTRTHGLSGLCFELANLTAPLAEGLPLRLREDREMNCTGQTGAQRA
jgi:hypothetical protein